MRRVGLPLFYLAILVAACQSSAPARVEAPADSAAGEIGIEWAGPNQAAMLVPVYINGSGPYSFVVDTGATMTCVDDVLATELSLPEASGRVGVGATIAGGGRVGLVSIDSMRVGQARAEDMLACSLDLSTAEQLGIEFDGLLGLNFLRSFRVTLDFERGVLTLQEP